MWKYVALIGHILSETICVFCFCALFLNMYPKIKSTTKIGLTYAISIVNRFCFLECLSEKLFFDFICTIWIIYFYKNIVKISEEMNKRNLLKICLQVTYPA